jgi:hypothetical protein
VIDDPSALAREVVEGWDVVPNALRLTLDAVVADPEVAPSWEVAARRYKASCASGARTIVRLPTACR